MSRDKNDELRDERERQEERREEQREGDPGERVDISQDEERHQGDNRH